MFWGSVEIRKTRTVETEKRRRKSADNLDIVSFEICVSMAAASVSLPTARRCR